MEYFYAPPSAASAGIITIEGDEFSHLTHVMRKKAGDTFRIVDGKGMAYDVALEHTGKHQASCRIIKQHHMLHEPSRFVILGVGILKNNSSFDFLVEKCTELGVAEIVPLRTSRTIPVHGKTARWQKLALAAMKQCGRCVLPVVHEPLPLADFLDLPDASVKFLPHEKVASPEILEAPESTSLTPAAVMIGPEGGFSEAEITAAMDSGFIPVSLGSRRLRTETAAIRVLSVLIRDV